MMRQHRASSVRKAFTLIEMLVVLLIIGILAAILFPVLKSARESGYQAACATNLHQIYLAVELYRKDEGGFPASMGALLGDTENLAAYTTATAGDLELNTGGKGYFKGGMDALVGPDDDTLPLLNGSDVALPRSSYGDLSADIKQGPTTDMGRYVWNYLGYRAQADATTCSETDTSGCLGTAYTEKDTGSLGTCTDLYSNSCVAANYASVFQAVEVNGKYPYLIDPNDSASTLDVTKLPRLINRFAPLNTVITHCVYHRLPTSNVAGNFSLYDPAYPEDWQGAKDIVLRLDGSAKVLDVSTAGFATGESWAVQKF